MTEPRFRAGSNKQLVWVAYSENGKEAAMKVAKQNGINPQSAKIYIAEWEKEEEADTAPKANTKRVFDIGNPKEIGTRIQHGKEVSEVQWASGLKQFIPNDKLLPEGFFNNDTRGCYKNASKFAVMESNKRIDLVDSFNRAKRMCAGNKQRFIYAITGAGLIRMVPRGAWDTFPNISK